MDALVGMSARVCSCGVGAGSGGRAAVADGVLIAADGAAVRPAAAPRWCGDCVPATSSPALAPSWRRPFMLAAVPRSASSSAWWCFPHEDGDNGLDGLPDCAADGWEQTTVSAHGARGSFGVMRLVSRGPGGQLEPTLIAKEMHPEVMRCGLVERGEVMFAAHVLGSEAIRELWWYGANAITAEGRSGGGRRHWAVPCHAVLIPLDPRLPPRVYMKRCKCTLSRAIAIVANQPADNQVDYSDWARRVTLSLVEALHDFWVTDALLHLDLKADNILVSGSFLTKVSIADLGNVTTQENAAARPRTSHCVTRWVEAPEAVLGLPQFHSSGDVWSLGCLLARVWLRQPLLAGESYIMQFTLQVLLMGRPRATAWPWCLSDEARNAVETAPDITPTHAAARQREVLAHVPWEIGRRALRFVFASCMAMQPEARMAACSVSAAYRAVMAKEGGAGGGSGTSATHKPLHTTVLPLGDASMLQRCAWRDGLATVAEVRGALVACGITSRAWAAAVTQGSDFGERDYLDIEEQMLHDLRDRCFSFTLQTGNTSRAVKTSGSDLLRQSPMLLRAWVTRVVWDRAERLEETAVVACMALDLLDAAVRRLFHSGWDVAREWMRIQCSDTDVCPLSMLGEACLWLASKWSAPAMTCVREVVVVGLDEAQHHRCSERADVLLRTERLLLLLLPDGAALCVRAQQSVRLVQELVTHARAAPSGSAAAADTPLILQWTRHWVRHATIQHAQMWGDLGHRDRIIREAIAVPQTLLAEVKGEAASTKPRWHSIVRPWMCITVAELGLRSGKPAEQQNQADRWIEECADALERAAIASAEPPLHGSLMLQQSRLFRRRCDAAVERHQRRRDRAESLGHGSDEEAVAAAGDDCTQQRPRQRRRRRRRRKKVVVSESEEEDDILMKWPSLEAIDAFWRGNMRQPMDDCTVTSLHSPNSVCMVTST